MNIEKYTEMHKEQINEYQKSITKYIKKKTYQLIYYNINFFRKKFFRKKIFDPSGSTDPKISRQVPAHSLNFMYKGRDKKYFNL